MVKLSLLRGQPLGYGGVGGSEKMKEAVLMHSVELEAKYLNLDIFKKILLGLVFILLFLIPALSYSA